MIKTCITVLAILFALTACEDMSNINVATQDQMYEWMHGKPRPKPEPEQIVIDSRYCYKSQTDVLCYDQPQLGKEDQFIGAQ